MKKIAVIGGGITGITSAYALAKKAIQSLFLNAIVMRPWKLHLPMVANFLLPTQKFGPITQPF
jgi:NADH dehydrogenase FAD-containing subunit